MTRRGVTLALFAGAALMVAAPAAAQIQVGTRVGEPAPVSAGTYESLGRRDPFVTLVAPRRTATAAGAPTMARPGQGLASLSIHDVVVTGIVRKDNMMMAIVQGSSQQSYVAKVNDRLADGVVKSIDARGVVFVEHSAPGSGTRGQETRKALRAAAEVNR